MKPNQKRGIYFMCSYLFVFIAFIVIINLNRPKVPESNSRLMSLHQKLIVHSEEILSACKNRDIQQIKTIFSDGIRVDQTEDEYGVYYDYYAFGRDCGGFYFSFTDEPLVIQGMYPPWGRYLDISNDNIQHYLQQQGNGLAQHQEWINPAGGNLYYTEQICPFLWYYELSY